MNRIENIKHIQIDVNLDGTISSKIERKDEVIEMIDFNLADIEKRDAMNEFLRVFQMRDITTVTFDGVEL